MDMGNAQKYKGKFDDFNFFDFSVKFVIIEMILEFIFQIC